MNETVDDTLKGQVAGEAAEVYEAFFVPALFGQWSPVLAEAARLAPGDRVLDVACGTGSAAREAARRVALGGRVVGGRVVGLDCNAGMLAVARRLAPELEWREGLAEDLPFTDASFDAVLCQFGLMFFEDRRAALREMWRVLAPGGRLALAVWDRVETSPGYAAVVALLRRLFGDRVAAAMEAPFVLGDREALAALSAEAGIEGARIETRPGTARFASIADWVHTDVKGWTLAGLIDDEQYARLREAAARELARFAGPGGEVAFAAPAHIVTAEKPGRA